MKICLQLICVMIVLNFASVANAQQIRHPALRQKLLDRLKEDQKIRDEIPDDPNKITPEYITRLQATDRANTKWMKKIIKKYGFPTKSLVCDDGVYVAFILVQHADLDREFQKSVLPLLEKAVRAGEAPAFYFAYLTDRTLTGEGKPQRFGSQLKIEDGKVVPLPIEDEANVDKRRAELGLPLMSEYLKGQKTLEMPQCRPPNKSLNVRAQAATFFSRCPLTFNLCGGGFAPRQFNRSASSLCRDNLALCSVIISVCNLSGTRKRQKQI